MLDTNDNHPDDGLLEMARMNASSDWEVEFASDMLDKRKRFGLNFSLSDRQRATLEKIAGE